jgi:hypothetical protein
VYRQKTCCSQHRSSRAGVFCTALHLTCALPCLQLCLGDVSTGPSLLACVSLWSVIIQHHPVFPGLF